ncbi:uncharacterized protein LOC125493556 [Beta vulgaris subsp. vulgaris]|uniref:uncharacterized protein LOC125493556 n=1 Tax=Beta vulgaris subsp. vulgaris TaxID=3555 RepID=UPI002036C082|nr:uncharacterized protein LOC125493556 [Beta vulgaris subsp. vulgaris]
MQPRDIVNAITLRSGTHYDGPPMLKDGPVEPEKIADVTETSTAPEATTNANAEKQIVPEKNSSTTPAIKVPFPNRLSKNKLDHQLGKFMEVVKNLHVTVPFTELITQVPAYAKFLKEILTRKRAFNVVETAAFTEECSDLLQNQSPPKLNDPGSLSIPYVKNGKLTLTVGDDKVTFSLTNALKSPMLEGAVTTHEEEWIKQALITGPIIRSPDWTLPFEIMCEASDYVVGDVLGQRKDNILHAIYYASKTLDEAQVNYATTEKELLVVVYALDKFRTYLLGSKRKDNILHSIYYASKTLDEAQVNYATTEKELLAVVYALDKFRTYLLGSKVIVYTNHVALKDKKGAENVVADHLSKLQYEDMEEGLPIDDSFPDDKLLAVTFVTPWYADFTNFCVSGETPQELSYQERKKFLHDPKKYFWDDPLLYKLCADTIYRQCIPEWEVHEIMKHSHSLPC